MTTMYSAVQVTAMIDGWKKRGDPLPQLVVEIAEACIGWPYVWGSGGQEDTVSTRKAYMNSSHIGQGDRDLIVKRCQQLNGSAGSCSGCKYFPNGQRTRMFDCRGFTAWTLKQVGITITGGGATSQWNTKSNWESQGTIDSLPKDRVCCIFRYDSGSKTMEHTLLYDGAGNYIHCSGEVKKQAMSTYKATHWAVPKGLYDQPTPTPTPGPEPEPTRPTVRRGDRGSYVTLLQTQLIQRGYDCGRYGADGIFGAATEEAVKRFQRDCGLTADGIAGPATYAALDAPMALYSVTVPHLSRSVAEEIVGKYGGTMVKEGGT